MKAERAYALLAEAIENSPEIPPCQITDPDSWFAEMGDWSATQLAKKLCGQCPVQKQCLEYALIAKEQFGVWGGLSARERQRLRAA